MIEETNLITEDAIAQTFTVIGFWPDTGQRFSDVIFTTTATFAEEQCLQTYPGIAVCGVIAGSHLCIDSSPCLSCN